MGQKSSTRGRTSFNGFEGIFNRGSSRGGAGAANANLKIPLSTAIKGGKISVSGLPGGSQNVEIPANATNGQILHVDTYQGKFRLKLQIEDEYPFRVKGKNIETTISINLAQAVLGSKIKIKGPRGDDFILTVPAGSQNADILRLRGLGLGGDFLVKLEVIIPKTLTEEQKEAFTDLAKKMNWKF